jgi:hypothetical protein
MALEVQVASSNIKEQEWSRCSSVFLSCTDILEVGLATFEPVWAAARTSEERTAAQVACRCGWQMLAIDGRTTSNRCRILRQDLRIFLPKNDISGEDILISDSITSITDYPVLSSSFI